MGKSKKMVLKYGWEWYSDPGNVSIRELAGSLGLVITNGRMRCPCPDHADNNPSTAIGSKGKNSWNCFSCGEYGGALELVTTVLDGVKPSEFWRLRKSLDPEERKKAWELTNHAVSYIEEHFPGNVTWEEGDWKPVDKSAQEALENEFRRYMTKDIYKEFPDFYAQLGLNGGESKVLLKTNPKMKDEHGKDKAVMFQRHYEMEPNPFIPAGVSVPKPDAEYRKGYRPETENFSLSTKEAAELVLWKIEEYSEDVRSKGRDYLKAHPELDIKTKAQITCSIEESACKYDKVAEKCAAFLGIDYEAESLDEEKEEEERD